MSFVYIAVASVAVSAGTAIYGADKSRKAAHKQMDAQNAAVAADAEQKAQSEANANAALVSNKRRRRAANGLLASTDGGPTVGTSVLGSASDAQPRSQIALPRTSTTLGGS